MTKEQQDLLNLGGEDGHTVESNNNTLPALLGSLFKYSSSYSL